MLKSRRTATAAQQKPVKTTPPTALLVVVLTLALIGAAYGLWRGHWAAASSHTLIAAITAWGMYSRHRGRPGSQQSPAALESAAYASSTPLESCPPRRITLTSPEPGTQKAALTTAGTDPALASAGLPIVDRLAITGRLRRDDNSTTGHLSLILPTDTDVTVASVINVLLTVGNRILNDHHLTDQPLPELKITLVDRTEAPPTNHANGFTVWITNNLATRRSDITLDTHQLPPSEHGPLLIAATLLAGAEHLLDTADPSFNRPNGTPAPQKAPPR